jgi:hypothetical protein
VPDATTEDAMTSVLEGLLAPLTDAHVFVRPASFAGPDGHALPFALGVIEDALLVVNAEPGTDVEVGDEVIELDGRDARVLLDAACARISARPVVAQFRAARSLVTRAAPGEATLLVARNGGRLDVRVSTREGPPVSLQARPEPLADLGGGVVYLDVTRVGGEQYEQVLGVLAAARAIVIDARGYPTDLPLRLLPHLTDEEMRSPPFLVPVVAHPDISRTRFVDVSTVMFQPAEPRLTRHVAVVIDANGTQSYAESVLALVNAYGLGTLVGEATTGTNGVVALRTLASGHRVRWTSWWVRQHDGSELFGRGVQPGVEVRRSVRGVRAGRDELLDAALNVVRAELVTSG